MEKWPKKSWEEGEIRGKSRGVGEKETEYFYRQKLQCFYGNPMTNNNFLN